VTLLLEGSAVLEQVLHGSLAGARSNGPFSWIRCSPCGYIWIAGSRCIAFHASICNVGPHPPCGWNFWRVCHSCLGSRGACSIGALWILFRSCQSEWLRSEGGWVVLGTRPGNVFCSPTSGHGVPDKVGE